MHTVLAGKASWTRVWHRSEHALRRGRLDLRAMRWFILLWVLTVSLWGGSYLLLRSTVHLPFGESIAVRVEQVNNNAPFLHAPAPESGTAPADDSGASFPLGLICVLILSAHIGLHWLCLSGKLVRRWLWPVYLVQGLCVLGIGFIWFDTINTLSFYLVLLIEALRLLKQMRQLALIASAYFLLFLGSICTHLAQVVLSIGSALFLVIFLIGWIMLSIQQVLAHSQLEEAHLQLAEYALRIEELTLASERQRLARELHDTLAQGLVGLTFQLERIDQHLEKQRNERARELVQQTMTHARATLAESRHAIDDLRVNTLTPRELTQVIQREITRFRETTSITCQADIAALAHTPEPLCEQVLRAITEGLINVARHSQAHFVRIDTRLQKAFLTIEVCDDGIGMENLDLATRHGHYGLLGLRERTLLCGGQLTIESAAGRGTMLRLKFPLAPGGGLA